MRRTTSIVAAKSVRKPASVAVLRSTVASAKVAGRNAGAASVTTRVRHGLVLRLLVKKKSASRTSTDERHAR